MGCSLIQKLALMPGCRPWDTPDPVQESNSYQFHIPGVSTQSPWRPPDLNAGEFSLPKFIQTSVSKVSANVSRLVSSTSSPTQQGSSPSLPWYDFTGKAAQAASATGDFIQSTLIKVIILVVVVGVIAVFGMSYVQAKGVSYAK